MNNFYIGKLVAQEPKFNDLILKTEGNNSKWGRLVCQWNEDKGLHHKYATLVNLNTGDIYLDCSKKKIYAKFILHTLLRPFNIIFKTVYHVSVPISIPHIIYKTCVKGRKNESSGGEIAKNCFKNSFNSLADIIRTPVYGVAMTIVSIAALIIGPLAPKVLYDLRESIGMLVQSLHRSDKFVDDLFGCFQPIKNLKTINKDNKKHSDTIYSKNSDHIKGTNNFARSQVKFRREHWAIFNQTFGKLDPNVTYISPSFDSVIKQVNIDLG